MAKIKMGSELPYKIFSPILGLIFKLHYRPQIVNKEVIPKEGPIIITCNHKHVMDQCPIIMSTKRVLHYMAKKEYFDKQYPEGHNAWFFKMFGCIPVDRSIHDDSATETALDILEHGGSIGIFPEGTRNKTYDQVFLPLKYGAISMAYKTKATIVPAVITGDYVKHSKNLMLRFGKPFKVESHDYDVYKDKLEKEMNKLLKENLKATNRTLEEELASRNQDQKKKN